MGRGSGKTKNIVVVFCQMGFGEKNSGQVYRNGEEA